MTIHGIDTSHHQALGNFPTMKASGLCDLLFAKATEGVGFADPQYAASRSGSQAAGMVFGSYHFARPGDPVAQANYYLSVARPAPGEIPILDMEDVNIPNAGAWSAAWCARVKAAVGVPPLFYTYPNFLATHDFSPVLALNCGLWLARYDGTTSPAVLTTPWPALSVKQWTDRGTVPGQSGTVDCNASPLTVAQLRTFAIGSPTPPVPVPVPPIPPTPVEDDMPALLVHNDGDKTVCTLDARGYNALHDPRSINVLAAAGYRSITISQVEHENWLSQGAPAAQS